MAIIKNNIHPQDEEGGFNITNGDYKLLKELQKKWQFKNQEDILRFALAVLFKAGNKKVFVEDENGNKVVVKPNEDLLQNKSDISDTTSGNP